MKKLLALVLSCIFVLLLASCGEELPASDYVKKGELLISDTLTNSTDVSSNTTELVDEKVETKTSLNIFKKSRLKRLK